MRDLQCEKALRWISVMLSWRVTEVRLEQLEKIVSRRTVTFFGIFTDLRFVQYQKASSPISVILSERFIEVIAV